MSYLTGKHMARRTFLRGAGATVALPFLDAMVPAGWSAKARAAAAPTHTRLVCIEEVHGLAGCNGIGAGKYLFAPEQVGRDYKLGHDDRLLVKLLPRTAPQAGYSHTDRISIAERRPRPTNTQLHKEPTCAAFC